LSIFHNGKIIELQSYFLNLQITEEERLAKKAERERLKKEAMKATLESLPENERRAMERAMAEERKFSKAESERLERLKKAARKDRRLQEAKDNLYKSERFINHISKFNNVQESEMNTYILGMYNTLASRITKRIKANKAIEKDDIEFLTKLYNAIPEYQNTRYASDFPNPKKFKRISSQQFL